MPDTHRFTSLARTEAEADVPRRAPLMRASALIATLAALAFATPAPASTDGVPGQLVVGFKNGVTSAQKKALIERSGGRLLRRLAHIQGTVVRVRTHGLAPSELGRRLSRDR